MARGKASRQRTGKKGLSFTDTYAMQSFISESFGGRRHSERARLPKPGLRGSLGRSRTGSQVSTKLHKLSRCKFPRNWRSSISEMDFRQFSLSGSVGVEMNTNDSIGQAALPLFAVQTLSPKIEPTRLGISALLRAVADGNGIGTRFTNQCLVAGLWLSALFAIWVTRGWIGLFLSGQVLSLTTCLFRGLTRGTQSAFATVRTSSGRFEGE